MVLALVAVVLVAAGATGGGDPIPDIVKYGISPVVIVLGLLTKFLYTGTNHREIVDATEKRCEGAERERDAALAEIARLRVAYESQVLPALIDATHAQKETLAALLARNSA